MAAAPRKSRVSKRALILGLVAATALGGGGYWWASHRYLESTDNAQVDAEVVAVPSRVAGLVARVHFQENQEVSEGDLLLELDDALPKAKVEQARASIDALQAAADAADADARIAERNATGNKAVSNAALTTASVGAASVYDQMAEVQSSIKAAELSLKQAEIDRDRDRSLAAEGAIPKAQADRSQTNYDLAVANVDAAKARLKTLKSTASQAQSRVVEASARADQSSDVETVVIQARAKSKAAHAQVDSAKAALSLAELDLSYTKIYAPHAGIVSKKSVAEGQTVAQGQTIVQLVTPDRWITANFKETQLAKLHPGESADFEVDAFPGVVVHGEVESVSGATGSRFTLLPPDNASGNFTKVVQRVPVRFKITDVPSGVDLRPGMSVEVTVNTK